MLAGDKSVAKASFYATETHHKNMRGLRKVESIKGAGQQLNEAEIKEQMEAIFLKADSIYRK